MKSLSKLLSSREHFSPVYYIQNFKGIHLDNAMYEKWFSLFFSDYLKHHSLKHYNDFKNSPDILLIKKDADQKQFITEDFSEVFRFQETTPLNANHKFCVIFEAEFITDQIYNKLLKIFEEPSNNLTFFLFSNSSKTLISTIESRVTKLRLTLEDISDLGFDAQVQNNFNEELENLDQEMTLLKFQDFYKNLNNENAFLKSFLAKISNHDDLEKLKKKVPDFLQWFQESKNFNNAKSERAFFIYQMLKAIQVNRKSLS